MSRGLEGASFKRLHRRDKNGSAGAGAAWALYAAAVDPRITCVVAERGLVSYRDLAQTAPRPLTLAPVEAMKRAMPLDASGGRG